MQIRVYLQWGSNTHPQDHFFRDYDLPFLPPVGMEFQLSVEDATDRETLHALPTLVVDRLIFIDDDPSLNNKMPDVFFKRLPKKEVEPLLGHLKASKLWQQ